MIKTKTTVQLKNSETGEWEDTEHAAILECDPAVAPALLSQIEHILQAVAARGITAQIRGGGFAGMRSERVGVGN